jgi:hypothetical protein
MLSENSVLEKMLGPKREKEVESWTEITGLGAS